MQDRTWLTSGAFRWRTTGYTETPCWALELRRATLKCAKQREDFRNCGARTRPSRHQLCSLAFRRRAGFGSAQGRVLREGLCPTPLPPFFWTFRGVDLQGAFATCACERPHVAPNRDARRSVARSRSNRCGRELRRPQPYRFSFERAVSDHRCALDKKERNEGSIPFTRSSFHNYLHQSHLDSGKKSSSTPVGSIMGSRRASF